MIFSSLEFLIFLLSFSTVITLVPSRQKTSFIIISSTFFYGYWDWHFTLLPVALAGVAFYFARRAQPATKRHKHLELGLLVAILFSPLLYYKYSDFFFPGHGYLGQLPLGLSFVTFTLVSYVLDMREGRFKEPHSAQDFLAYITFFPQLIAGPIIRPGELIPQIRNITGIHRDTALLGAFIFFLGLTKKVFFADQLSTFVDEFYGDMDSATTADAIVAFYGFPIQIYNDFSGYSDMAIGLGLFFGVTLPINFLSPFSATNLSELWRRWHITMSSWFRDYVYLRVLGAKRNRLKAAAAAVFTMTLIGLWHGAAWHYVVFGLISGISVALTNFFGRHHAFRRVPAPIKILLTFHCWSFLLIMFRAETVGEAVGYMAQLLTLSFNPGGTYAPLAILLFALFFIMHGWDTLDSQKRLFFRLGTRGAVLAMIATSLIVLTAGLTGGTTSAKFIYFDF